MLKKNPKKFNKTEKKIYKKKKIVATAVTYTLRVPVGGSTFKGFAFCFRGALPGTSRLHIFFFVSMLGGSLLFWEGGLLFFGFFLFCFLFYFYFCKCLLFHQITDKKNL